MRAHRSTRVRSTLTVLVTVLIVVGELGFLTAVYHLDDGVDRQRVAQVRLDTALTGVDDRGDAVAVLEAAATTGDAVVRAQRWADVLAAIIHATLLVLVSLGWFVWFRTLVRRHRKLQPALTERQVVDAGERRLLALVHNSTDLVAVLDPDSTASFVSPAVTSVLGLAPDQVVGHRFAELLPATDAETFVQLLAAARDGEHPVLLRASHVDGRELSLEGTLNNLLADPAVQGWVLTVRDVTERQKLQSELTHQAFHDALTGLANRQLFSDRLAHALRRRDSVVEPLVVLFLDLDDFKDVNDSLGHGVGDRLLVGVAERIAAAVREGDTAARLGGDEFAILLEGAGIDTARIVADRMLAALRRPIEIDGQQHTVQASIGMAEAVPGQTTGEEALRNADVAMYWAKDRGKGTVAAYEPDLHRQALDRLSLRSRLNSAIRGEELVLHYQPTVDLSTGAIAGFEALARWQHPERGLLGPAEFIALAERSGLILPLGRWVLREACRAAVRLQGETSRPTMAVNVAVQQLGAADFVDDVAAALADTGLAPERLVLEITENALLDNVEATVAVLRRIRALGVRVAIDDFGTGYSSLAYLSQLPVDVLKVDKAFVDRVCRTEQDGSLVDTIVTLGRGMGLTTVAEGVEEPAQARRLLEAQCSLGQGYLWSQPVDLDSAERLVRAGVVEPAPEVLAAR
jgi:diguanylate cyclase (GGDEF)-like protein/PAS domain S-box-containing protein